MIDLSNIYMDFLTYSTYYLFAEESASEISGLACILKNPAFTTRPFKCV